jgi:hypothetical protein
MSRPISVAVGALIAVASLLLLVFSVLASQDGALDADMASAAPFLGTTGIVIGGIGLAIAALVMGVGMGRWSSPKAVPTSAARKHEGLQE